MRVASWTCLEAFIPRIVDCLISLVNAHRKPTEAAFQSCRDSGTPDSSARDRAHAIPVRRDICVLGACPALPATTRRKSGSAGWAMVERRV